MAPLAETQIQTKHTQEQNPSTCGRKKKKQNPTIIRQMKTKSEFMQLFLFKFNYPYYNLRNFDVLILYIFIFLFLTLTYIIKRERERV